MLNQKNQPTGGTQIGFLQQNRLSERRFPPFHITDEEEHSFSYHYHDFYKILIFIRGDVTYHIEGKSFD